MADGMPGLQNLLERIRQSAPARVADRGVIEPGRAGRRRAPAKALERVQPDVVVVAARGQEGQLITDAAGDAEAEHVAVEGERAVEVRHLQVHMADLGAGIDRRVHAATLPHRTTPGIGAPPNASPEPKGDCPLYLRSAARRASPAGAPT